MESAKQVKLVRAYDMQKNAVMMGAMMSRLPIRVHASAMKNVIRTALRGSSPCCA